MHGYTCPMTRSPMLLACVLASAFVSAQIASAQPAFPHADRLDAIPEVEFGDADMQAVARSMLGQWRSADESANGWTLRVVRLKGRLLTQPLYMELVRDGMEATPARQWIMSFYRSKGELRARAYEFPMGTGLRGLATGLWAAPDMLPVATPSQLEVVGDFHVERSGEQAAFTAVTPFLLNHHSHWSMDPALRVSPEAIEWSETIFDRNGDTLPTSSLNVALQRDGDPPLAQTLDKGVRIIDLREGRGGVAELSDVLVFWYTGWLKDGTVFETNRLPGSAPFQVMLPSDRILEGWSIGLPGIKCTEQYEQGGGGLRKIIVPPEAGLGRRGGPAGLAVIPPNSTLIFLIEMIAMKDNKQALPEMVEDPFTPAGQKPPPGVKFKPGAKKGGGGEQGGGGEGGKGGGGGGDG